MIFVPNTLLAFGSGFIFKQAYGKVWIALLLGTSAIWLGTWIGSIIAFLLGRYLFTQFSERLAEKHKVKAAFDEVVKRDGVKFITLLRLSPVPYNVFNYAISITAVSLRDYAIGGVGMVPLLTAAVFVGTTLGSLSEVMESGGEDSGKRIFLIVLMIVGCIVLIGVIVWISIVVKRRLDKAIHGT